MVDRRMEEDLTEGYDRDYFLETEDHYKEEDEKTKRYGGLRRIKFYTATCLFLHPFLYLFF
jgi:hypothetical protein